MDKVQPSESSTQENFILRIRECAEKLAINQARDDVLSESAHVFADFAGAQDALIIDLSRETLDVYRSKEDSNEANKATVVLEESVAPILDLLRDRYLHELGIRFFNKRIVNPPESVADDLLSEALDELGLTNGFILPLTIVRNFGSENILGILLINGVPSHRFADPAHLALLRMAADLLSLTADNADLGNALARLRPTDQMTGLASKNKLLSLLNQEVSRSNFLGRSFALILADIDDLRSVNMRQGYRYADLIIKTVAEDILLESRAIDTVCRWGGAEYLVLMPESSSDVALDFAERCRKRVAAHPITPNDYLEEIFITLSFGVVSYPEHGSSSELLLRNVDLCIVQAKLNGKNQSLVWQTEWSA